MARSAAETRGGTPNPDAGKTKMVYDAASNLTQKITANLAQSSKAIFYDYEFNRLKSITYPLFPENNVTYTYGPSNAQGQPGNVVGRITKVTDESGSETRKYGKLGEIVEETRTIASDTQGKSENSPEVWTTSYEYDTWGRLQRMAYPDGELLTYSYDSGGLPHKVTGNKQGVESAYVQKLEYDKFEQRVYLQAGNGVETEFTYDAKDRRLARLQAGNFQDLHYKYDDVGNILELDNKVPPSPPKDYGGPVTQTFQYDGLYRLTQASGSWRFEPNKRSEYSLTMAYNSIHNITKKTQSHDVVTPGGATIPQKKTSYDVAYTYGAAQPHAPSKIAGSEFLHHGGRNFHYDANGNQLGWDALKSAQQRSIVWDEENRIQSVSDNGRTTTYKYNDAGERVVKRGEQGETAYVNQFFTVRNRSVGTKHVFVGETRLVSKLVPGDAHVNPGNNLFGNTLGQWWWHRSPNGHLHGQNINKNPHYAGNVMPQKLPEDNFVYFYHPDHVGSTSYVTDYDGALYEHVQYFPFGETWVSEQSNTERLPYLFTSKELDEETALYYFGARYYDPRTSVWQSTDPGFEQLLPAPGQLRTVLVAQGGLFNAVNLNSYGYSGLSPIVLRDPSGRWSSMSAAGGFIQPVHQMAIENVLANKVSPAALKILKQQQVRVDQFQKPNQQHVHAMTGKGQSRAAAIRRADSFVRSAMSLALKAKREGNAERAFRGLGTAIHTLQDATSPAHRGFQPWMGMDAPEKARPELSPTPLETAFSHALHGALEIRYPGAGSREAKELEGATRWAFDIFQSGRLPRQFFDSRTGRLKIPAKHMAP